MLFHAIRIQPACFKPNFLKRTKSQDCAKPIDFPVLEAIDYIRYLTVRP